MAGWITLARERVQLLQDDVDNLNGHLSQEERDKLGGQLTKLRSDHHLDKEPSPTHRLVERWTGNDVNETWNELHRIECRIESQKSPEELTVDALKHARKDLTNARVKKLEQDLKDQDTIKMKRLVALDAIKVAHFESEARHEAERQQERGILTLAFGLLVAAVLTVLMQAYAFGQNPFVTPPEGVAVTAWALLALIMMFGMLGGAFSALISLYVTNKTFKDTDTMWFDPRPALSVMKTVMGLWTAVIGLLAVGSGLVVGVYTSIPSVVLLSFLFGYGQQTVTSFMDRKVGTLMEEKKPS